MKKEIILLLSLTTTVFSNQIKNDEKKVFVEYFRVLANMREEFPNKTEVKVIFGDFNDDGKYDALATYYGNFYQDGWLWTAFTQDEDENKWVPLLQKANKSKKKMAWVKAKPDEFYRLKKNDISSPIMIIRKFYGKGQYPEIKRVASQIVVNDEGILTLNKIPVSKKKMLRNYERIEVERFKE